MIKIKPQKNKGYAIVELLFYFAFFAVLSLVVIEAMIVMSKSFKETLVQGQWMQGTNILERMSREIRAANDMHIIGSNDLTLNTTDEAGEDKTIQFLLSNNNLAFLENGVLTGNLNSTNVVVTGLTFTEITTAVGKAVKIVLTVRSTDDLLNRTQTFYNTVVLRGIY